jgi:hypothetical protein
MARPAYKPTQDRRHEVMVARACGMSHRDIAAAIRIDVDTLNKHFARELLHGPEIIRQELLASVTASAIAGKRGAINLLQRMTREGKGAASLERLRSKRKP